VEKAIARAQTALQHSEAMNAEEIATTEAALEKSLVQLHLKRRKK